MDIGIRTPVVGSWQLAVGRQSDKENIYKKEIHVMQ
jgi:hypothetical protein